MRTSTLCPLMWGDTPTSSRTFDAFIAGCTPLFVGMRLWGRCDPPCKPGFGWRVSGTQYPHLPFQGLWIDWASFPVLSEYELTAAQTPEKANAVLNAALKPLAESRGGGSLEEALRETREYVLACRKNLIYGFGDYRTSNDFGLAPRRLIETALFRLRGIEAVSPPLPDPVALEESATRVSQPGNLSTSAGAFGPLSSTLAALKAPFPKLVVDRIKATEKNGAKKRAADGFT